MSKFKIKIFVFDDISYLVVCKKKYIWSKWRHIDITKVKTGDKKKLNDWMLIYNIPEKNVITKTY